MAWKDIGIVLDRKRLPDGGLELTFSSLKMGFTGWLCTICKQPGEAVEDDCFPGTAAVKAPWIFRVLYGLGELKPVLRIADGKGNSVWFYHGWDRKQRERIYLFARSATQNDAGGDMLIDREAFVSMVTRLRAIPGQQT